MIQQECVNFSSATIQEESSTNRPSKRSWMEREKYVCGQCFQKLDAFSDPRLVNCLHSICSKCADNIVQGMYLVLSNNWSNLFWFSVGSKCNLCQTVIDPQWVKPDLFFHKTVIHQCENSQLNQSSFGDTNNNVMNGLIISSESSNDTVKCVCCSDVVTASFHCKTCNGPICDSCNHDHGVMRMLRGHKIEKRNLAEERSVEALKFLTHCKEHQVWRWSNWTATIYWTIRSPTTGFAKFVKSYCVLNVIITWDITDRCCQMNLAL